MPRTLTRALVIAVLAASLFNRSAAADDKCTIATKGDSPVAKACAQGGRTEAKKLMKAAVKAAKEKGGKFTCDGCHKDNESYTLLPKAREELKKLLALSGVK